MSDLMHYGTKRHSGRYPWGSGENPYQRLNRDFLARNNELKAEGLSEIDRAKALGCVKKNGEGDTAALRAKIAIATSETRKEDAVKVAKLRYEAQMSIRAISKETGIPATTVRSLLDPEKADRNQVLMDTADILKDQVSQKGYVDVGKGTNLSLDITEDKLKKSLYILKEEGYHVDTIKVEQVGTGHYTEYKVLYGPDKTYKDLAEHKYDIQAIDDYTVKDVDGKTKLGMLPPKAISSDRVAVRYAEDGGIMKDGVMEIRRGVEDLSLGKANYAQVRISVDGTHYLKGMAMYSDDLPDGVDIIFNTNKKKGTPMMGDDKNNTVLKQMKADKDNPFGATIKQEKPENAKSDDGYLKMVQQYYIDKNGEKQQSCINVVNEQGDWGSWSKTLASQFLSKQPLTLAEKQLNLSVANKKYEFEELKSLTQPEVRGKLLEDFANGCDSDAVHLKAAALPRQASKVILPSLDLKPNECYCPTCEDGESVVLIRYPHGGRFEIPELKVNNKANTDAKRLIGPSASDAIGINAKVAEQLSGADFDGDSVLVIPVKNKHGERTIGIAVEDPLPGLVNFDPKEQYKHYEGMERMTKAGTQQEMGKISNLITDMTLKGAPRDEIERAVKHSMVVIDAEKHYLNYKQSYIDNGIAELKERYQGGKNRGASTIISRAKSVEYIPDRKLNYKIDEKGNPQYRETGEKYLKISNIKTIEKNNKKLGINGLTDEQKEIFKKVTKDYNKQLYEYNKQVKEKEDLEKRGLDSSHINLVEPKIPEAIGGLRFKEQIRTTKSTKMFEEGDARNLVSDRGTRMEYLYADYANKMKAMGNAARIEADRANKDGSKYNANAAKVYKKEVDSLNVKLKNAQKNAPKERQAQLIANSIIEAKRAERPELNEDKEQLKKVKNQSLAYGRACVGASKQDVLITITDREWQAIQAGAIRKTKLKEILNNCDSDQLRELATPRTQPRGLSQAQKAKIKAMIISGHTIKEIAGDLGISTSTVSNIIAE